MNVTAQMLKSAAETWGSYVHVQPADRDAPVDFVIVIDDREFLVEVKASGSIGAIASALGRLKPHLGGKQHVMLAVPFMSEAAGDMCRAAGVSWFDLSGNADISADGMRIKVRGFANRFASPGRPSNAFTTRGSRVARAMLVEPDRRWGVRELAEAVDMLPGTVSKVLSTLRADGFVERDARGDYPRDPQILLEAWSERYSFTNHRIERLHTAVEGGVSLTRTLAKRLTAAGVRHAFTGSAAAYFVEPAAGFRIVVVYVLDDPRPALGNLGIRPVEGGENIWIVTPEDEGVLYRAQDYDDGRIRSVCLPQMYLDLRQLPERSPEIADVLKQRGLWGDR